MTDPIRRYAVLDDTGKLPVEQLPTPLPIQVVEGAAGKSAYQLAVEAGFVGTEQEWLASLAATPQPHPHPYAPDSHALDGAYHSGSEVLPTQGQKNALAGTSGTPGVANPYVTTQDGRMTDARTPLTHSNHAIGDTTGLQAALDAKAPTHAHPYEPSGAVATHAGLADPHPTYATDADLSAHAATAHGGSTPPVYAVLANGATAMGFGTTDVVKVTPTANATYTTTVPAAGHRRTLLVLTSGTQSRTITFGTGFKATATLATGTTTGRVFAVEFVSDGTNLYETSRTVAMAA